MQEDALLDRPEAPEAATHRAWVEGTAEALGVVALVNAASTTRALLADEVRVDSRGATNLVAHRDGPDGLWGTADDRPFATVAEIDAVPYIGSVSLERLFAWAGTQGWVPEGDEPLGVWDSVSFTVDEAASTVAYANQASFEALDVDLRLDRRAVEGIFAIRPVQTVLQLSEVPYVGSVAMGRIKDAALAWDGVAYEEDEGEDCLIFSEYVEGQGNNNKAVEIFNCGGAPIDLFDKAICLVVNDDDACTRTARLEPVVLDPGAVFTVCRTLDGTFNDPLPTLRDACDQAMSGVMTFNGDDRLLLFHDANGTGRFEAGSDDAVLDAIGRLAWRPAQQTWADVVLRRCNLTPYHGVAFYDHHDWFTEHGRTALSDLGQPPAATACP